MQSYFITSAEVSPFLQQFEHVLQHDFFLQSQLNLSPRSFLQHFLHEQSFLQHSFFTTGFFSFLQQPHLFSLFSVSVAKIMPVDKNVTASNASNARFIVLLLRKG